MPYSPRSLVNKVRETVARYSMIKKGDTVLVAVSGGPDSVSLLHALMDLRDRLGFKVAACHLDHGFRGEESRKDAEFVARMCSDLGIPCEVAQRDVPRLMEEWGVGAEEAGRRARYRFYEEAAERTRASRVALGHTLDDQAETVLMRLIRGSGVEGLGGIPPVRGKYIRPLLFVTRLEIEEYCKEIGAEWRVDRSNLAPVYFRNQARLQLIPSLERWNPRLKETLAATADILREDAAYLETMAGELAGSLARREGGRVYLARKRFLDLHPAMQRRLIRRLARETMASPGEAVHSAPGYDHVEAVMSLAGTGRTGSTAHLPGGLVARVDAGEIVLEQAGPGEPGLPPVVSPVPVRVPGITRVEGMGVRIRAELKPVKALGERPEANRNSTRAFFDYALVEEPLVVRSRADGDYFYPLGLGGRKKVGDFMTSLKIPVERRPFVPIVLSGDRIIWVGGYRLDDRFKVTPDTTEVLVLALEQMASQEKPVSCQRSVRMSP